MSEPRTFLDGRVSLFHGDCREVLKQIPDNSIDSCVVDPPYHLTSIVKRFGGGNSAPAKEGTDGAFRRASSGFMNKTWDGGDIAFQSALWMEVLRCMKPGAYIFAFSGCRTYHRMACAIEDAGFITHPFFAYAFGSGFPKAHSVSRQLDKIAGAEREIVGYTKGRSQAIHNGGQSVGTADPITAPATDAAREWDGWFYGTQACKPALEPVYFGQKPFEKGLNGAQNVLKWGVGAINVAACKVGIVGGTAKGRSDDKSITDSVGAYLNAKAGEPIDAGRWPSNLITDGSPEVLACFPETGVSAGGGMKDLKRGALFIGETNPNITDSCGFGDSGSAARFFASFPQEDVQRKIHRKKSLNENSTVNIVGHATEVAGLAHDDSGSAARYFASFPQDDDAVRRIFYTSKADSDDRLGSKHPTVKPLDLIQYLVRLITPKNGVCLDLFAGTGTTAEACFREGFRCILIEREDEYIEDIERRMSLVMEGPDTRAYASMKARNRPRDDGPLFGFEEKSREPNLRPSASPRRPYADDTAIWGNRKPEAAE